MRRALALARRGRYTVAPNPRVGAVIERDGVVVGEGWHERPGGPHAEIAALAAAGDRARGATMYVTLEPCTHHGRTPPCVDALLAAEIARLVACHRDPDPRVAGSGFERLRAAGVEVAVGELAREARLLNLPFLVSRVLGRPAVTLKWAMSLDGRIATAGGESRWLSSPPARRWALALREEHDAILVGSGTVLADDPRLDRRLARAPGPILRVILDRRLRTPATAGLFAVPGPVLVYTESASSGRRAGLESVGAEVVGLPQVAPEVVVADLARRGVQSLLVEGGGIVAGAFADAGLVDRVAVAGCALLVGGARAPGPLAGVGAADLQSALRIAELRVRKCGTDVVLEGESETCLQALSANADI
ncbi:MAG: bifunctional diaminohydroxyphosphoribosylaminopyrimidine deaminase/5-amino-6-(5-phosphoribosylamino)uracil reductase RibD [Thermoanaerobaculia bacterium]